MSDIMEFGSRDEFRKWLCDNCLSSAGIWVLFGKAGGPKTIKAGEALEEALCFGWIDGQMEKIDEKTYKKYFSMRRENSKWSDKNKELAKRLEEQGRMTDHGRKKIEDAKKNGQWDAVNPLAVITEEQIAQLQEQVDAIKGELKADLEEKGLEELKTKNFLIRWKEIVRQPA